MTNGDIFPHFPESIVPLPDKLRYITQFLSESTHYSKIRNKQLSFCVNVFVEFAEFSDYNNNNNNLFSPDFRVIHFSQRLRCLLLYFICSGETDNCKASLSAMAVSYPTDGFWNLYIFVHFHQLVHKRFQIFYPEHIFYLKFKKIT